MAEAWTKHGGTVREAAGTGETWLPEGLVFEATAPDAAFDNVMRCGGQRACGDGNHRVA